MGKRFGLASQYDKNSTPQKIINDRYLKVEEIDTTVAYVLDIACGDGKTTAEISKKYPNAQIIGIDNKPEQIERANTNHKSKNIIFIELDANDLLKNRVISSKKYDVITCFFGLHWIKEEKQLLESIKNLLKQGGQILIVTPIENLTLFNARQSVVKQLALEESYEEIFKEGCKIEPIQSKTDYYKKLYENSFSQVHNVKFEVFHGDPINKDDFKSFFRGISKEVGLIAYKTDEDLKREALIENFLESVVIEMKTKNSNLSDQAMFEIEGVSLIIPKLRLIQKNVNDNRYDFFRPAQKKNFEKIPLLEASKNDLSGRKRNCCSIL